MMIELAVLIPCFNNPAGLTETLRSLEHIQTAFDVTVVDDGSSPPLEVPSQVGSHTVHTIRLEKNQGIEAALNAGLTWILEHDYSLIARLDTGDEPAPDRFEKQLAVMLEKSDVGLVGVHTEFIRPSGERLYAWRPPTDPRQLRLFMHVQNPFVHSGVMYRVDAIRNVGMYGHDFPAAEDYDLFWRISQCFDVAMIGEVLMRCELNPVGISVRKRRRQSASLLRVRLRYFNPRVVQSYVGVVRGAFAYVLPLELVNAIKGRLWR
jgi:glycosyltransferase involved in cell wall biosynthesis